MDDELAVPLDGVVQPRPAAVVLHAGVAARGDQEARDVLVPGTRHHCRGSSGQVLYPPVLAGHEEGSPVMLVHNVHLTARINDSNT